MKLSTRPRKTANLSKSLSHQLNMYSLAASAAGVGMLALAQPTEAKIVYTPSRHRFQEHGKAYQLDLNHDGMPDFKLGIFSCRTSACSGLFDAFDILGRSYPTSNVVACNSATQGFGGNGGKVAPLKKGSEIPSAAKSFWLDAELAGTINGGYSGRWFNVKDRYVGLKFYIKGEPHYGWARLSVETHKHPLKITGILTGYAYETIPSKSIIAGKTKGSNVVTVQPPSLGHLSHGASAIPAWRRKDQ